MFKMNKLTEGSNIMWESSRMMLPEHVEAIHNWKIEENKQKKPFIDEQQWEQFSQMILQAKQKSETIQIKQWEDGYFYTVTGMVHHIDAHLQTIRINIDEIDVMYVNINNIVDVQVI